MSNETGVSYSRAIQALKERNYTGAAGFLKAAENQFADNLEFRILSATAGLLLAVKEEINKLENSPR